MFRQVYLEIAGVCNARCPWCVTGNRSHAGQGGGFMTAGVFEKVLRRLLEQKLISPEYSVVNLYNWGEPSLNPEFENILDVLVAANLRYAISTNGSRLLPIKNRHFQFLDHIIFSIPGFSQVSYNRIHQLEFSLVKRNIETFLENAASQFSGIVRMAYHVYQFNITEITEASAWCRAKKIDFAPVVAFFNDFDMARDFLKGSLDRDVLRKAGCDLLLYYVDSRLADRPQHYRCPQYDILTLDESGNVLTCCAVPRNNTNYSLGSVFDLSAEDIVQHKVLQAVCKECQAYKMDYWFHNPLIPDFVRQLANCEGVMPREIALHYKDLLSNRFQSLVTSIVKLLEVNNLQGALNEYSRFRWCFPNTPEVIQIDEMMKKVGHWPVEPKNRGS